jgi:hypothetical protein
MSFTVIKDADELALCACKLFNFDQVAVGVVPQAVKANNTKTDNCF